VTPLNRQHLERAVRVLRAGGVIAYPTEGVWGLGCDPFNAAAVARILRLKGRSPTKGLILVAGDVAQVQPLLGRVPTLRRAELLGSWPGPVTWIVPVGDELPRWITGRHDSVAIRVSDHFQIAGLCRLFGGPIVSTSANLQGRPAARSALTVRRYFRGAIDYLLPGELGGRRGATTIREALTGRIVRPG
jgi:L-threonylcarbamoyladenylate synthase